VQVYLAKWQETDVAVKVITQMQNLSPFQGLHPQDPATMELLSQCRRGTARRSMELVDEMTANSKALQGEQPQNEARQHHLCFATAHELTWLAIAQMSRLFLHPCWHCHSMCLHLQLNHTACS
jgi:hypothetical protein